jgi:serine/threonine protein kinase
MNFLNTNVVLSTDQNNGNNNEVFMSKVKTLLTQNRNITNAFMNNTSQKLEYIGEGINGSLYKIQKLKTDVNDGKHYIVKVFKHNTKLLPQIRKELRILKKLETNESVIDIINPCIDTILTKAYVITVFDSFNGMTLRDFVRHCHRTELDAHARDTLLKYCFKQIFISLHHIHSLNVCHLQLTPESILVKLNISDKYDKDNNTMDNMTIEFDNQSGVEITDVKGIPDDKINPVNTNVYRSYKGNSNPVVIKFTNFGLGCGKLPKLNITQMGNKKNGTTDNTGNTSKSGIHANVRNVIEKCNLSGLPLLDPYISSNKGTKTFKTSLLMGKHYDFFNVGIIGLMCIVNKGFFESEFSDARKLSDNLKSIPDWENFVSRCGENLLDSENFNLYYNNIRKYCIGALNNRKDTRYIQNNILIMEKHPSL